MIISCEECSATLQLDETKVASESFSIRCPKCRTLVRISMRGAKANVNGGDSALASNSLPSAAPPVAETTTKNWDEPLSPAYVQSDKTIETTADAPKAVDNNDILHLLASLLQQHSSNAESSKSGTQSEKSPAKRKILLCFGAELRNVTAQVLSEAGYTVSAPESLTQAIETLRELRTDIVVFAPNFAPQHSGAVVLQKHINSLNSYERRHMFVVALDDQTATYDTHEAFLRNLNLIVQTSDTRNLPHILKQALREFDELYQQFNAALAA